MSLIYLDSFDGYTDAELSTYWVNAGAHILSSGTQRTGTSCLGCVAGSVQGLNFGTFTSFIVGGGFSIIQEESAPPQFNQFLEFICTGTEVPFGTVTAARLACGVDYILHILDVNGNVVGNCTNQPLREGQYHFIEWSGAIGASNHHLVYVDGQKVFDGTLNVINGFAGTQIPNWTIFQMGINGNVLVDDFYIAVNDGAGITAPVGDSSIFGMIPSGSGGTTSWTPHGSTSNWQNVATIPENGGSDYNESNTSGAQDLYVVEVIRGSGSGINNYTPSSLANSDTIQSIELIARASQGTETGAQVELLVGTSTLAAFIPTTFTPVFNIISTLATGTLVNATQWGIEHV